ncbi:protein with type I secretion target domain and SCP-like extracellular domain [Nostoc commune NIES-4072]|uniref:Protein with type I secretion target domain and SCP-like extracellular domain n=1 Tax=Nostoc commune NIES-4072 TaxID=2005467 RepID=A0A2R5FJW0_NOSCO|nr:calcium-binding protein [Nostoc commune]BBD69941.1 protein with type I secretion target domain and SCP-like extracellular domain [Nostoc commune HK-02]GBG19056.1 protein with type I secretion target domain and SCP-like extracellular domain [Nostoc commune NIES-4072]
MATLSIEEQELEELKDPTAGTFDTSQAEIIKPVFSTLENTQLATLAQLEAGTYVAPEATPPTGGKITGLGSAFKPFSGDKIKFDISSSSIRQDDGGDADEFNDNDVREFTSSKDDNKIIIGTPNADTLYGANGDDVITSLGIDDIVSGRNGDDLISGGSGNDYLQGDGGKDIVYGDYSASGNSDLIASGNDTIFGGDGNDKLYGQDGKDLIYGDSGDDYIEGGADNDQINGDDGNDILYGDDVEGNPGVSGDDTISGNNGNDKIFGGRGNDFLEGDAGKDLIFGGQGYDSLDGGNGNDVLIGTDTDFYGQLQQGFGFGEKDTLIGGKNNDTFVLGLEKANARDGSGTDTVIYGIVLYNDGNNNVNGNQDYALIKDFGFIDDRVNRGVDKIQLAGSASQYLLGASPDSSISGTGIFFTQGQFVAELIGIVEGISLSDLSLSNSDQFIFV